MAVNFSEWSSSSEDSDVLMIDPFLDYVNNILMDEGMDDDATFLQQAADGGASNYDTIFSSLQDIIAADSASHKDFFDPYQSTYCLNENGPHGSPNVGLIDEFHNTSTGSPTGSLPANAHPGQSIFQQERPLKSTKSMELRENKNGRYNSSSCLISNMDAACPPIHHSAINSNDAVLTDAIAFCGGNVEGLRGHTGQEQSNAKLKLPSADEECCSKLAELDLSFEDLKLDDVYTSLYVKEPSSSTIHARNSEHNGDKKSRRSSAGKGRCCKRHTSEVPVFVEERKSLICIHNNPLRASSPGLFFSI